MSENGHPTGACLRYNTGKVELCYLLSFDGACDLGLLPDSCRELARWYQGEPTFMMPGLMRILDTLPGDHWRTMCEVSMAGARKYTRGNYLKGSPWSSICNSLLRHLMAIEEGHELDDCDGGTGLPHAGHVAWNCAFLLHCVRHFPEHDDRLRANKLEFVEPHHARRFQADAPEVPPRPARDTWWCAGVQKDGAPCDYIRGHTGPCGAPPELPPWSY